MSETEIKAHDEAKKTGKCDRMRMMRISAGTTMPGASRSSHYSDEWYTPGEITAALGPFDLDPCAGPMQHARQNWGPGIDGLALPWTGRVWMNPPYSTVNLWIDRFMAHGDGIALVSARPETKWFQRFAELAHAVHWLRGRVKFVRPDGKPTHPVVGSVLVAYGHSNMAALCGCALPGLTMSLTPKGVGR